MRTKETQKKKVHDDEVAPPVFRTLGGKLPSDGGGVPSALHNLASRFIGTTFNFYCAAHCTKVPKFTDQEEQTDMTYQLSLTLTTDMSSKYPVSTS